jgi:hypothetical protein
MLYAEFLEKLKKDKSKQEFEKFIADLVKFGSTALYTTIQANLSEQDMEEIEKIDDEIQAQIEVEKRFMAKTGKTPTLFMEELRDEIAKNYMFPELMKKEEN